MPARPLAQKGETGPALAAWAALVVAAAARPVMVVAGQGAAAREGVLPVWEEEAAAADAPAPSFAVPGSPA